MTSQTQTGRCEVRKNRDIERERERDVRECVPGKEIRKDITKGIPVYFCFGVKRHHNRPLQRLPIPNPLSSLELSGANNNIVRRRHSGSFLSVHKRWIALVFRIHTLALLITHSTGVHGSSLEDGILCLILSTDREWFKGDREIELRSKVLSLSSDGWV